MHLALRVSDEEVRYDSRAIQYLGRHAHRRDLPVSVLPIVSYTRRLTCSFCTHSRSRSLTFAAVVRTRRISCGVRLEEFWGLLERPRLVDVAPRPEAAQRPAVPCEVCRLRRCDGRRRS